MMKNDDDEEEEKNNSTSSSAIIFNPARYNKVTARRPRMVAATMAQLTERNCMSSHDKHVLCLGMLVMDYCVVVDEFPVQDTKQTASAQRVGGGGNAANTAVQLSKLGVKSSLISKVGQILMATCSLMSWKRTW